MHIQKLRVGSTTVTVLKTKDEGDLSTYSVEAKPGRQIDVEFPDWAVASLVVQTDWYAIHAASKMYACTTISDVFVYDADYDILDIVMLDGKFICCTELSLVSLNSAGVVISEVLLSKLAISISADHNGVCVTFEDFSVCVFNNL